jgi:hypothetical protein
MEHIQLFEQFIQNTLYNVNEKFTYADAIETAGEDLADEDIASALKALNARSAEDIYIMAETPDGDAGLFDAIKKMKKLPIDSLVYTNAYAGKYKGKNVVVFGDGEDLFAYTK